MSKVRIVISLFVASCAIVFALRHSSLRQFQAEQAQLRQQAAEVTSLRATVAQASTAGESPASSALSSAERAELLRLRGGIGRLRQELAQTTNQIAGASQTQRADSSSDPEERAVTKGGEIRKMERGRGMILALIICFNKEGQRLPATLAEAALAAGYHKTVDDFELVHGGVELGSYQQPGRMIVLREKRPWKSASGRWGRVYAFADGHVEYAYSTNQDFNVWEEQFKPAEAPAP